MNLKDFKKIKISDKSGVYFFLKGKEILYIGKATSLKDRARSYFNKDLIETRGPMILDMIVQANKIKWQETDSVLEALIQEAELIKKHQPKYNIKEKDDKSWNYVCIIRENTPKVLIVRGRNLKSTLWNRCTTFGPYTNSAQLKEAMKIIRRIFPYFDEQSLKKNNIQFYQQLKLTPESLSEYKKNIANLKLFFQGKKKKIIQKLKKEMMQLAKHKEFEKAGIIKKRIFALEHINDVALIKEESFASAHPSVFRIEAYDVAHLSGKNMVGVMTVLENGEIVKNEYRKFIIKTQEKANDTGALEEILSRRLRHTEWGIPDLIIVDGNIAQMNVASRVLARYQFKISVVGVVKDEKHKAKAILGDEKIIQKYKKSILIANSEAHRFAISFYRIKNRKSFLNR